MLNYPFFDMKKVECSENESFCRYTHKIEEGYPTINIFINGKFHGEYPGADEIKPFMAYIKKMVTDYEKTHKPEIDIGDPSSETKDGPGDAATGGGGFNPWYLLIIVGVALVGFIAYRALSGRKYSRVARVDTTE